MCGDQDAFGLRCKSLFGLLQGRFSRKLTAFVVLVFRTITRPLNIRVDSLQNYITLLGLFPPPKHNLRHLLKFYRRFSFAVFCPPTIIPKIMDNALLKELAKQREARRGGRKSAVPQRSLQLPPPPPPPPRRQHPRRQPRITPSLIGFRKRRLRPPPPPPQPPSLRINNLPNPLRRSPN